MPQVKVLHGFEHAGSRKRGDSFEVSDNVAEKLRRNGLVEVVESGPAKAAGGKPSASQAAPASPQTTSKPSGNGGKKKVKKAAALS